ncbi:NB-ARC domain-containing protein [Actinomadura madurae]|uniref:AfsR/SARP family transcriptional regulator n=1 Tax=Actinomadura madurae TaxID=1993 RepID=UPI0020270F70|nr:BTAD domain-containing putative transcriptional regulator [Actinomadura madurae]URN08851.1 NB-ARC domain-containing protein [Actinomadura madurae]
MLGPLLTSVGGRTVELGAGKQRALLATLALAGGEPVSYDRLADCVWGPRTPAAARTTLHSYVGRLRQAIGPLGMLAISSVPGGYRLDVHTVGLDLMRFRELTAEAARRAGIGDTAGEAELLRDALALWRGPLLADVPSETLHREDVPPLVEERLDVHERRIDAELRLGRYSSVVAELRGLTAEHPWRERFWAQLMTALHGAGRAAEALTAYRLARHRLAEELGLEPGEHLRRLESAILRGEAVSDIVPAGARSAANRAVPHRLPPGIGALVGRDEQIDALVEVLHPDSGGEVFPTLPVALVTGGPGTGKTALAVQAAHLVADSFPDGRLYLDLRNDAGEATAGRALARLLRSMEVEGGRIPDDLDERTDLYRTMVSDRRILVVLDNVVDEAQVRPLLPDSGGCAVLLTSRARLGGIDLTRRLELGVLAPDDAVELIRHQLGHRRVAGEQAAASELARLCCGLPLAIRIATARLLSKPHWPLARMVARLRDEPRRLDELAHGALSVRARLALVYDELDEPAKLMFRRLALLRTAGLDVRSAMAVTGMDEAETEAALERLVDARLIDVDVPGVPNEIRYRFHDLIRLFARATNEVDEVHVHAL